MLKRRSGLDVVFALHVGHVRTKSRVRQLSLLIERRRRTTGNESRAVREHVSARIVVKAILTNETAKREQRRGAEQAGPHPRDVKRFDLRALILGSPQESGVEGGGCLLACPPRDPIASSP